MKFIQVALFQIKKLNINVRFIFNYRFLPPPFWSDISHYEILLDIINQEDLLALDGDFVEIGAFLGGGTYKLCKYLEKKLSSKKVYSIDIFNPDADATKNHKGNSMNFLYSRSLRGQNQLNIYKKVTKKCNNLITIIGDSKNIKLSSVKIAFAYVDGNHSPVYVRNDFNLIWKRLVSGGIIAFDDYGDDLPSVTKTINCLIQENINKIYKINTSGRKTIFIKKV